MSRVFTARPRPADMDYRIRNSACMAACCIVAVIVALTVAAGALGLSAAGNFTLEARGLKPTVMSVFEADRILGFNDSAPFRK
ncbi:hypothetical protein MTO96_015425 [Rhipicephalus appendiculatus]